MAKDSDLEAQPKISFQRKLMGGAFFVLFLFLISLAIGNGVIEDAAESHARLHSDTVKPLAEMSDLQTQMYRLRVTEANLLQLNDYFALASEVSAIDEQIATFSLTLSAFTEANTPAYTELLKPIEQNWLLLSESLGRLSQAASSLDKAEMNRLSDYETTPRFDSLTTRLKKLADHIERDAEITFQDAALHIQQERHNFFIMSLVASVIGLSLIFIFARYLSSRVSYLHAAFKQVSEGNGDKPVTIKGNDELAELAVAFNVMREKVALREDALHQARRDLEVRVQERTKQLSEANRQLLMEIEERRKIEEDLRLLSLAVSQTPVSIIITRVDGEVEYVNQAFSDCTGYSIDEIKADKNHLINQELNGADVSDEIWAVVNAGEEWRGELTNQRKNGEQFWEYTHISPVTDNNGGITHFLLVKADITERKEQDQKILYQARYDSLTELPNRTLAMDRLSQGVSYARRNNEQLALMFIDLDGFKHVNDSLGHEVGDVLLVHAAARLKNSVRESDTVARLGGDEFLVIMSHLPSRDACFPVLEKIQGAFSSPFKLGSSEVSVTPSIGLSIYPEDGEDGAVLLRNADLAMYQAKEAGRNTYHFFNQSIHENLRKRLDIEKQLEGALSRDEFFLLYQPIIDGVSGDLVGVEALLRWENEVFGRVMPDEFIGIAEQSGLIIPIGNWVIKTAIAQVQRWHQSGLEKLALSINVSPRQIQGCELKAVIDEALAINNYPAEYLTLEMTEGLLIRNPQEAITTLSDLKKLGLKLAMDDFGTGYSSLSNLKKFPFDILKIDRTFVRDIEHDADDFSLVSAAVSMSRGLGLTIVAEGVETEKQVEILTDMQCDCLQGFYYSRPLSNDSFWSWARHYNQNHSQTVVNHS